MVCRVSFQKFQHTRIKSIECSLTFVAGCHFETPFPAGRVRLAIYGAATSFEDLVSLPLPRSIISSSVLFARHLRNGTASGPPSIVA
jgi:hypothetical protein